MTTMTPSRLGVTKKQLVYARLVDSSDNIIDATYPLPVDVIGDIEISNNLEGKGDITIGTTEVAITITGTPTKYIRIQADDANTGIIFIGKTGVLSDKTNDFVRLKSGDEVILPYNDATVALYAISDTAAQTINVGVLL